MGQKAEMIIQKAEIIKTSMGIFSVKGFADTNMIDIADAMEISRGPLYYHYKNKNQLFIQVVQAFYDRHLNKLRQIFDTDKNIFVQFEEDLRFCHMELKVNPGKLLQDAFEMMDDNKELLDSREAYLASIKAIKIIAVKQAIKDKEIKKDAIAEELIETIYVFYHGICAMEAMTPEFNIEKNIFNLVDLLRLKYST